MFSCECCEFFKNSFFYRTPPVAAFMSVYTKGKKRKACNKGARNVLQVLVLVKTEIQIQVGECYRTAHPFFLTFSSDFLSCDLRVFIFCVFIPDKPKNISCWHLLVYSEAGIESCFVKQLFSKI